MPGKGSFAAPKNLEMLREENLRKIEEHMTEIQKLAATCGLTREEIMEMFTLMFDTE